MKLDDIDINIFRHVVLDGLYIQDLEGDTLLYTEHAAIRIRSVKSIVERYSFAHPGAERVLCTCTGTRKTVRSIFNS